MNTNITLFLTICILVIAVYIATKKSRDEFYQTVDQSKYPLQGKDQNPWKQFASTFGMMQLSNDCSAFLDYYSKYPTEENYAKLLNCNLRPEEYSKIKSIAATFAGPK